jgi:hypothetical protein
MGADGTVSFGFLVPIMGMAGVFALNHAMAYRRTQAQADRDAARLRAALAAEFALLREMIEDNLRLIAAGAEHLLSTRGMMSVYRSNVGRLSLLSEAEIAAVVTAYATVEGMEVFLAGASKPHGAHAYRVLAGEAPFGEITRRAQAGCTAIAAALAELAGAARWQIGPPWLRRDRPRRLPRPEDATGAAEA